MVLVPRKQLERAPETNINYISAVPRWFKFVVDYTDVQAAATSKTITLCTAPIKFWVHAVWWKVTTSFSQNGDWVSGGDLDITLRVSLGDEDLSTRWLDAAAILAVNEVGSETPTNIEDGSGLTPWEADFDNTHDLEALFEMRDFLLGDDLNDLDAGEITFWFLLSSMNDGAAG